MLSAGDQPDDANEGPVTTRSVDPRQLTGDRITWLARGLATALPRIQISDLLHTHPELLTEASDITVAVARASGEAVGLLATQRLALPDGLRLTHITAQFVGEQYRRHGAFTASWSHHLRAGYPDGLEDFRTLAAKTCSPRMYASLRLLKRFPGVAIYPEVDRPDGQSSNLAQLAAELSERISPGCEFEPATGVVKNAVRVPALYRERLDGADPKVNEHFARHLGPQDRFLCIASIPADQVQRFTSRYFTGSRGSISTGGLGSHLYV
jgi:hypothetical protein